MARCQTCKSRNEELILTYRSLLWSRAQGLGVSLLPDPWTLHPGFLEVLGLGGEVEVIVFILVLIVVVEVAEAGGEGGCGQHGGGSRLRVAILVDLHAERQAHLGEDLFDLVQGLAAEVLGLQHFGFGLLDEFADGGDVGILQAVVAADGELELFDRAVEVLVAQGGAVVAAVVTGFHLLFKVDEDGHVVLEQLRGEAEGIGWKYSPVGPDLDSELVVVGDLTETSCFDEVVDLADGRVDGVDGNETEAEVTVEVLVGRDVAAAALEAHLHVDLTAFADGANVDVLVEDLDIAVGFDHAGGDDTGLVGTEVEGLGAFTGELEGNLLEVQDDVGRVFDDAGDGLELVQNAFDADCGYCSAFDGREKSAAKGVADGGTEAALKGLRGELAVLVGDCFGVDCETLGLLKTSPKHVYFSFFRPSRDAFCGLAGCCGCGLGCVQLWALSGEL